MGISKLFQGKKRDELETDNPDQILKSNSSNFSLPYEKIEYVRLENSMLGTLITFRHNQQDFEFLISGKLKDHAKELVNYCLPGKIRGHEFY